MTMDDLKRLFEDVDKYLQTQWYRRHEALKYELEDLEKALKAIGQYDDEFTLDETLTYNQLVEEYKALVEEYEIGDDF